MSDLTIQYQFKNLINALERLYQKHEAESIAYVAIEHVLNYSKFKYVEHRNELFPESATVLWNKISRELLTGKPIQYIIGVAPFYGKNFELTPSVLIPRPETEELVDLVLKENPNVLQRVLDIGTGSGCIPVSLKCNRKNWDVFATDISEEALSVAKNNAVLNNAKIGFYKDDIFNPRVFKNEEKFNIIISNPPYIPQSEKTRMHKNVIDFEPQLALFIPDEDAIKYYRAISLFANYFLAKGGKLYVEIHENFGNEVAEVFNIAGMHNIEIIQDINGKPRIVKAFLL